MNLDISSSILNKINKMAVAASEEFVITCHPTNGVTTLAIGKHSYDIAYFTSDSLLEAYCSIRTSMAIEDYMAFIKGLSGGQPVP